MKKLAKVLLTFVVGITMSVNLMAQVPSADPPAGMGTQVDPYQIATLNNLYWITQNSGEWDKYYEQTADIDATTTSVITWTPIGSNFTPYFTGVYDGKNKKIMNLNIHGVSSEPVCGIFGRVNNGTIKNLGVIDATVNASGSFDAGVLVGACGNITIENCYTTGSISGALTRTGGIIGQINGGKIENSYSRCSVSGGTSGGLIGNNYSDAPQIINCYSTGIAASGGFIGAVIGLATFDDCFWDMTTSLQNSSAGGTGKNTAEMKTQSTFTNWDFTNVWLIDPIVNDGYPYLNPTPTPGPPVPVSDWAIYFGIFLIAAFMVVRYRRVNIA